jgi:hypothetical protein
MLASWNQRPFDCPPAGPSGQGFLPTACEALNAEVRDGGNNGRGAWTRIPISVLNRPELTRGEASALSAADAYREPVTPELPKTRFRGEIDITQYYRQALRAKFFPGQRGYWVKEWVGFEGDIANLRNEAEPHGIEWGFLIFENHGPFRVEIELRRFEIALEPSAK